MSWKSASPLLRASHKVLAEEEVEVTVGSEAGKMEAYLLCVGQDVFNSDDDPFSRRGN